MSQEEKVPTRKQIVAARGLLEMTQEDLARAVGVSIVSINAIENGRASPRASTLTKIRDAFERRGIEFSNGDEPGVKLRPSKAVIQV